MCALRAGTEPASEVEEGDVTIRSGQGWASLRGQEFPAVKGMAARPKRSSDGMFTGGLLILRDRLDNPMIPTYLCACMCSFLLDSL